MGLIVDWTQQKKGSVNSKTGKWKLYDDTYYEKK